MSALCQTDYHALVIPINPTRQGGLPGGGGHVMGRGLAQEGSKEMQGVFTNWIRGAGLAEGDRPLILLLW